MAPRPVTALTRMRLIHALFPSYAPARDAGDAAAVARRLKRTG